MADITQDSFNEALKFTKVIFQRDRDVRDSELNEFQDILRFMLFRQMYNAHQNTPADPDYFNPGSNDDGYKVIGTGAANQVTIGAGFLFCDGIPIQVSAQTLSGFTTYGDGGSRTDVVYLEVTEVEVSDPSEVPQLGETTRRRQLQATLKISTTGLGGVPASTTAEIFHGGVRNFPIASINRPSGQAAINAEDVTDLRKKLLPEFTRLLATDHQALDSAFDAFVALITGSGGSDAVGSSAISDSPVSLSAGSVFSQISALLSAINTLNEDVTTLEESYTHIVASYGAGLNEGGFSTVSGTFVSAISINVANCQVGDILIVDATARTSLISSSGQLELFVGDDAQGELRDFEGETSEDFILMTRAVVDSAGTVAVQLRVRSNDGQSVTVVGNDEGSGGRRSKLRVLHLRPGS